MPEKTDHIEEGRQLLRDAAESSAGDPITQANLREAQVHAQLAIATELRGIREALETFGEGDLRGELSQALTEIVLATKQAVDRG